jgi:chromosomal replication initiator protein
MSLTPAEAWSRILEQAKSQLPEQTFRSWLEPTEALAFENGSIVVGTPDQFAADWIDSKHGQLLASLTPIALGEPLKVQFKVHEDRKQRSQMDLFIAPPGVDIRPVTRDLSATMASLNARYTFDNFVIGKSNELAAAAALAVAEAPAKVYNPLFIYGDTGLGKTHLMQAIAHFILQRKPETRMLYIGTEQFTNELVSAIQTRTTPDFRRKYRETDLLLIDDVHFLKNKGATQEEFFHTFNALYEAGRQIVITSDRPPSDIPDVEARLITRFQWGMVADVELPDLEHRIAILHQKAHLDRLELTIPDDVILFIAEHVRTSVRELEGSITKLLAFASLKHRQISVELAREALRDKLQMPSNSGVEQIRRITVDVIQEMVSRSWGISVDAIKSKTRTKTITEPRQVAMYLIREMLGIQLTEIGASFGGRDHSTVIHSIEKVALQLQENQDFKARVFELRRQLRALQP